MGSRPSVAEKSIFAFLAIGAFDDEFGVADRIRKHRIDITIPAHGYAVDSRGIREIVPTGLPFNAAELRDFANTIPAIVDRVLVCEH